MSRLRKRTWTALERTIMKWFKVQGHQSPIWIIEAAEKIIRTKGYDSQSIAGMDHRVESVNAQWSARYPDADLYYAIQDAREPRYWNIPSNYWDEHPDNPNILIRRHE